MSISTTSARAWRAGWTACRDGRTAYATVDFAKQANDLAKADITRVIDAEAARAPGLNVQLGGQAIEQTEQTPLGVSSAVGVLAAAVVLFIAFGSLLAIARGYRRDHLISTLRNDTIPAADRGTTLRVYIGGVTATFADFATVVNGKLRWFILTIVGLSFLLLVVVFRSLLIPGSDP
jgi:uncharacterized membrane protein YdfJ with MMPL/SSD domain